MELLLQHGKQRHHRGHLQGCHGNGEREYADGRPGRRREGGRPTYRGQVFANLDATRLPRLAALGEHWEELTARDTYDKGVRAIVHGLLTPVPPAVRP